MHRQVQYKNYVTQNYIVFDGAPSTVMSSQARCIFEQVIFSLVVTLTFDLLISKFNLFICISNCT